MKPSAFRDSHRDDADQWITEMERYFAAARIAEDNAERSHLASTYLKDAASTWYSSETRDNAFGLSPSWAVFKAGFLARFRPVEASRMARAAIRNLRHRVRVAGYTQEFQRLLQRIPDMSTSDQIDNYIHGLQSHIAQEVDREQPKTLAAAMEVAQRVELLLATRRSGGRMFGRALPSYGGGSGSSDAMDVSHVREGGGEDTDFYFEGDHHLNALFGRGGSSGGFRGGRGGGGGGRGGRGGKHHAPSMSREEYDRLMKEDKCFKCKKPGHIARHCPSSASESKN